MKTLLLIRHAKAKQHSSGADFDRPLSHRGTRDATAMAQRVKEKGIIPELLVTSSARRALDTARGMAVIWDYPEKEITAEKSLYLADTPAYEELISSIPDHYSSIAVFGHNPTVGMLADSLTTFPIDRFPTCSVAAFRIEAGSWADFQTADKKLLFIDIPARNSQ